MNNDYIFDELNNYTESFALFEAEDQLYKSIIPIGYDEYMNESYGIVNEDVGFLKSKIIAFVNKIIAGISKAWEKFRKFVGTKTDEVYLKSIQNKVNNVKDDDLGFTITNFPSYNINRLDEIKVQDFNYEQMKESLDSENEYIKRYYSMLNIDNEKTNTIELAMEKLVIQSREDKKCDSSLLKNIYRFCSNDYKQHISRLENDSKSIQNSSSNIQRLAETISSGESTQESVNLLLSEAAHIYYVYHEDDNNDDEKEKTKMGFKDPEPKDEDGDGKPDKPKKGVDNTTINRISTYLKVSSSIVSAKMKLIKDMYTTYMEVLKHFAPPLKVNTKKKDNESNNDENNEQNQKVQSIDMHDNDNQ